MNEQLSIVLKVMLIVILAIPTLVAAVILAKPLFWTLVGIAMFAILTSPLWGFIVWRVRRKRRQAAQDSTHIARAPQYLDQKSR